MAHLFCCTVGTIYKTSATVARRLGLNELEVGLRAEHVEKVELLGAPPHEVPNQHDQQLKHAYPRTQPRI